MALCAPRALTTRAGRMDPSPLRRVRGVDSSAVSILGIHSRLRLVQAMRSATSGRKGATRRTKCASPSGTPAPPRAAALGWTDGPSIRADERALYRGGGIAVGYRCIGPARRRPAPFCATWTPLALRPAAHAAYASPS
ncbi:hypothetical protein AURDEDRAFT_188839 [Auricularia subglabra TFB-10046 SS5]|uniref:Uncharacterized protein n=1 Tax=Auricularia subglabra (strain TFB-10046 / SS5) TaxID=717982 RepID=J0WR39_AURST|nr:hypothetical protein AURDEDRAFT_188839 [Auricularia subglabra TFB-10046 SS5]